MRKIRKKFKRPKVIWDSDSIKENKSLAAEYGLKRMKEILISHDILRGFRQRARQLIAEKDEEKEEILMKKLEKLGLLAGDGKELDDVLALTVRNVLDRRLETIVFRKGVATTPIHARQLIVHGHVRINGRKVKFPSYLVPVDEEKMIVVSGAKPKPKKPVKPAVSAESKKPDAPEAGSETKAGPDSKEGKDGGKPDAKDSQQPAPAGGPADGKEDAKPESKARKEGNDEKGDA